jgi:hypothetical protein
MKIHVVLVSEQTLPNLIPILMEQPSKVYLLASHTMLKSGNAKYLADTLEHTNQTNQTKVEVEICEGMPDYRMNDIQNYVLESAAKIRASHPDADITINATGGNKLMSMGLVEAWRRTATKIIYVDTQHRRIEILPDANGKIAPPLLMQNQLDVPLYLRIQKFKYVNATSDSPAWIEQANARKAICNLLAQDVTALTGLISDINRIAMLAIDSKKENGEYLEILVRPQQELSSFPRKEFLPALNMMSDFGFIIWKKGSKLIQFVDIEKLRFLRGGWLEEHAWHVLHDEKLFDVRHSVKVTDKQAKNEFDVLACHLNQLLFIECKTLRFNNENDNDIAYKIDSLGQDARGLFGETWLLSARIPTTILKDRAAKAHFRIIGPDELPNLRAIVKNWMHSKMN